MSTSYCDIIKNRGIRIAVLYTVYDPLPTNTWYMNPRFQLSGADRPATAKLCVARPVLRGQYWR